MATKKTIGTPFKQGNKAAKNDTGVVKRRMRRSPLRSTLKKLQALEPKAIQNIDKSINGEEIDKSMVDTSKWLIQQLQSLSRAATNEEAEINGLRLEMTKANMAYDEDEQEEAVPQTRFSLHVLPSNKDL